MRRILAVLALLLCAVPASAATTSVSLGWDANTEPDLVGYRLYHATVSGGPYPLAGEVAAPATTWTHTGLVDGLHCWVATAHDTTNESGYSNEVCTTLDATAPAAPRNLRVTVTVRVE